jgi:hypothetical protein
VTQTEIAVILRRMDGQDEKLDRIEAHVERTNGRVTELERKEIDRTAREDERQRIADAAAQEDRDTTARRAWMPGAGVAMSCVFVGWALSHFVG